MLKLESQVTLDGVTGREITDFLLKPTDAAYQSWWPGTHLQLHPFGPRPATGRVGDVVLMDEYIGSRRMRMTAVVIEVIPGEKLVWQLRWWRVRLPARLTLALRTRDHRVVVTHTITAGWSGLGRVLDPALRLYFSPSFERTMDQHVHTEFPLLRDLLHRSRSVEPPPATPRSSGTSAERRTR